MSVNVPQLVALASKLQLDQDTDGGDPSDMIPGVRMDSVREFQLLGQSDAATSLRSELTKMLEKARSEGVTEQQLVTVKSEFQGFSELFGRFLQETGPSIEWSQIQQLSPGTVHKYEDLPELTTDPDAMKELLNKLVVLKLNGGLATSMGCTGPKSVISVRSGLTFLDLTVKQIERLNQDYKSDVPLVLMNSFNTHEDTLKVVRKYQRCGVKISTFSQSRYPRINKESLLPIASHIDKENTEAEWWYPPGHGDVYAAFANSGLLEKFIKEGRELVFISNVDNLGATVDLRILASLLNHGGSPSDFVMEVTDKTRADVKGGTLIKYEGKLRLLEIAQVPLEFQDEFKSMSKFKIFNTNNLWVNLKAMDSLMKKKQLHMEVIVNNKMLGNGMKVIQLETASGAAMKNFEKAHGINVPRSRFLPVKTTADLLLIMSNLYELKHGILTVSPLRNFPSVPLVKLGTHFKNVKDFLERFPSSPDVLELDHLTVSGDVWFGKGITLKGTVIIIANHGERIDIPSGTILENKIVSGNLRILDH
ncbi:UTP--glucose-1-phosphate uridylyltransferase-like [Corticium candelabrum]|uniref:UTP--glucose-1-phosphate uridylyltransferase-like n=1 Tax=Corticium candelabrum TaxID=121492 RepID=UPI002E27531C|nr:UTP--glucose-1-phosphate uridylyltransferase-like [Corticium candelabrum]